MVQPRYIRIGTAAVNTAHVLFVEPFQDSREYEVGSLLPGLPGHATSIHGDMFKNPHRYVSLRMLTGMQVLEVGGDQTPTGVVEYFLTRPAFD